MSVASQSRNRSRGSQGRGGATLTWEDKQLLKLTEKAMVAGFREAGKFARTGIRASLGGAAGSSPGQAPGKVSGDLQRAVSYKVKKKPGRFIAMDVGVLRPSRYDREFPGEMYAQALRLARGYAGRDREGRAYIQAARPFVDPFINRESAHLADIVRDTASTWMPKAKRS